MVPDGKFTAEEIPVFSVTEDTVEVFAGLSGVTLKKLPALPEIPMDAVVPARAALVAP
jgi:hypothetical protein